MTTGSGSLEESAETLYRAVSRLIRVVQFRDRDAIVCRGISVAQSYALQALVWHGPHSVTELAEHLLLDTSTVSRMVDALVEKGLACREVNPEDRRAVIVSATEAGASLFGKIAADMVAREQALIADLDPDVIRAAIMAVGRLADEYEERARAAGREDAGG